MQSRSSQDLDLRIGPEFSLTAPPGLIGWNVQDQSESKRRPLETVAASRQIRFNCTARGASHDSKHFVPRRMRSGGSRRSGSEHTGRRRAIEPACCDASHGLEQLESLRGEGDGCGCKGGRRRAGGDGNARCRLHLRQRRRHVGRQARCPGHYSSQQQISRYEGAGRLRALEGIEVRHLLFAGAQDLRPTTKAATGTNSRMRTRMQRGAWIS